MKSAFINTAILALVVIVGSSVSTNGQTPLVENLAKNKHTLTFENGKLSGNGAEFLVNEARGSHYFLIGENHGIADIPQFTTAFFKQIHKEGYNTLAVEAGPVTARLLEKLAVEDGAFGEHNRKYPFSLPFYFWREEAQLLTDVMAVTGGKTSTIWGLDQEFAGSPAIHLERLYELAPDADSKKVIGEYLNVAKTEFRRVVEARNPALAFIATVKTEDFDKMDAVFAAGGSREAKEILAQLRESAAIYQAIFTGRNLESNQRRAALMKRNFAAYHKKAQLTAGASRILFKFGSNHVKRGRNYSNAYDLGNFVSEIAAIDDTRSFHLLVVATSGTSNAYLPFLKNDADKAKKIDPLKASDFVDISPLLEVAETDKLSVVDLRPLRNLIASRKMRDLPEGFEEMVWGFDAVLLMPNVTAATLFPFEVE